MHLMFAGVKLTTLKCINSIVDLKIVEKNILNLYYFIY